jgi:hypothetical protein
VGASLVEGGNGFSAGVPAVLAVVLVSPIRQIAYS